MIPRPLGLARDHDSLVDLLRARKEELGLSNEFVDEACLTPGWCQKLLGPSRVKTLGRQSLDGLLISLGCALVLVEDLEHVRLMEAQWERRQAIKVHQPRRRISDEAMRRISPMILGERARLGGLVRAQLLTSKQLSEIASKAARARWRKARAARAAKSEMRLMQARTKKPRAGSPEPSI